MKAESIAWFPLSQRSFTDVDSTREWPLAKKTQSRRLKLPHEMDVLETRLRLRGYAAGTIRATPTNIFDILQNAARIRNARITVAEAVADMDLLAAAASERRSLRPGGGMIRPKTLTARFTCVRVFFRTCFDVLGIDPGAAIAAFDEALRQQAVPVGRTYRLSEPSPHEPLPAPSYDEIEAMLAFAAAHPESFLAERDVAFIACLVVLGPRLSEIIGVDGADFEDRPDKLLLRIRAKGRREEEWLWIPHELRSVLEDYVNAFNSWPGRGAEVIGIGQVGAFWRGRWGRPWNSASARAMLKKISSNVASQPYAPHSVRRSVHRRLLEVMPREQVSQAMRRKGTLVMDKYYGHQPGSTNWRRAKMADHQLDGARELVEV